MKCCIDMLSIYQEIIKWINFFTKKLSAHGIEIMHMKLYNEYKLLLSVGCCHTNNSYIIIESNELKLASNKQISFKTVELL